MAAIIVVLAIIVSAGTTYGVWRKKTAGRPSYSTNTCNYTLTTTGAPPVPMPHQLILCSGETYCSGDFLLVSLYDYN